MFFSFDLTVSFKVDMYAVEAHRSAPSWIFTATNDSVVSWFSFTDFEFKRFVDKKYHF